MFQAGAGLDFKVKSINGVSSVGSLGSVIGDHNGVLLTIATDYAKNVLNSSR